MNYIRRYKIAKGILLFWCFFIGIGAVYGSILMLIDPSGKLLYMDQLLPYFQVLPFADVLFQNYIFSGIMLFLVNGVTNLLAAILIIKKKYCGLVCATIFGITLMLWITIQFIIFEFNVLSTSYFIFGLMQLIAGYTACVFYKQINFEVIEPIANKSSDVLIIYFSRMGYVKTIAAKVAKENNADIFELKTTEKTDGTSGFWWCGRYAMHRWPMKLEKIPDTSKYKKIIVITPVWVFSISAPIREFLMQSKGQINEIEYIIVHYQRCVYKNVIQEMAFLCGMAHKKATSITVRQGKIIKQKLFN